MDGGRFKDSDNLVVERSPDGSVEVRFVPVSAASTEYFTVELIDRYKNALTEGQHHPVLLVGLFVLDLLTIHPFADGNGRVVRALTNALLDDSGYTVDRYVSLEQLIAESADGYYAALLASTQAGMSRPTTRGPGWRTSPASSRGPTRGSSSGPCPTGRRGQSRTESVTMCSSTRRRSSGSSTCGSPFRGQRPDDPAHA